MISIADSFIYCIASCFIILYLLYVQHKVFKETKSKLRETFRLTTKHTSLERTVVISDLTMLTTEDSFPRSSTFNQMPRKTTVENSVDDSESDEDVTLMNKLPICYGSVLVQTTQGIQILLATPAVKRRLTHENQEINSTN